MDRIARFLNKHLVGNVFDKLSIREAYKTDRSLLSVIPRMVAIPETTTDLRKIIRFSHQLAKRDFRLPITVRGGGNDKTGAAIGNGMLISMEKMNKIQEIDVRNRLVRVQAGITLEELNIALSLHGLTIPIAGHEKDTIGGLIANCPTDDYAGKYGGIYQCVEQAEIVLSNSDILQTKRLYPRALTKELDDDSFAGSIYRDIGQMIVDRADVIGEIYNKPLNSAGYSTISLVQKGQSFDLLPLFFNSQGTLGIVSEVILHAVALPVEVRHLMITSHNLRSLSDLLEYIESYEPLMINVYDAEIFRRAIKYGNCTRLFAKDEPKGNFVTLISFNFSPRRNKRIIRDIVERLPINAVAVVEDKDNTEDFQTLYNMVASYLNDGVLGEHTPILDDVRIERNQLYSFIADVKELSKTMRTDVFIFGSYLTSNYSVRPELIFDTNSGRRAILQFLRKYAKIVDDHQGSVTGGGPEGSTKALVNKFTPEEKKLYTDIKLTFDPQNILNPHVKLGANLKTSIHRLRNFYNNHIVTP